MYTQHVQCQYVYTNDLNSDKPLQEPTLRETDNFITNNKMILCPVNYEGHDLQFITVTVCHMDAAFERTWMDVFTAGFQ